MQDVTLESLKSRLQFLAQIGYRDAGMDVIAQIIQHEVPNAGAFRQQDEHVAAYHQRLDDDVNVNRVVEGRGLLDDAEFFLMRYFEHNLYGQNSNGGYDNLFWDAIATLRHHRQDVEVGYEQLNFAEHALERDRTQTVDAQEKQLQASMPDMADKVED